MAYRFVLRPRLLGWGASTEELGTTYPGDDIVAKPLLASTRAITIDASPLDVWPWLAQMGYRRGGLYSYDRLDRLFGYLDAPSADTILGQFQNLSTGDVIPLGRGPSWPVALADPGRSLVLEPVPAGVSWAFLLRGGDSTTRLISRVRVGVGSKVVLSTAAPLVELPWFMMERHMLLGIKQRAERLANRSESAGVPAPGESKRERRCGCASVFVKPGAHMRWRWTRPSGGSTSPRSLVGSD